MEEVATESMGMAARVEEKSVWATKSVMMSLARTEKGLTSTMSALQIQLVFLDLIQGPFLYKPSCILVS